MVYHRPMSGMYRDNYSYGTNLASVSDVESRYRTTLSKTHLRSDRGDLGMYTFAGSNLHGGTPAAAKGTGRATSQDLYAPWKAAEYNSGYYNHLRATTPEPRRRRVNDPYLYDEPIKTSTPDYRSSEYKTMPSKVYTDFEYDLGSSGDRKRTTTKTTVSERWVPLTTYMYNTPYHTYYYKSSPYSSYTYRTADDLYSYNYADDYRRYGTSSSTNKNIDALDLSISSKNIQQADYSHYSHKCNEIQSQLDEVNKWVYEAEMKIKNDVANSRSKLQTELAEISMIVEDTARYNEDLYSAIKKQAKQISTLNSQFDEVNRHVSEISDTLEKTRLRCQTLQSELSSVHSSLDMSSKQDKTVDVNFIKVFDVPFLPMLSSAKE